MTNETRTDPVVDFLIRLRKIDKLGLTARDVLMLYTIIARPGISGIDAANAIGIKFRSGVAPGIGRLIRAGFIEDRREQARKANPAQLHPLPEGEAFWNDIKPV